MYAPKPKRTKNKSEIHAPNGPPMLIISWLVEKEEKPGSFALKETSAIKIYKHKPSNVKPRKLLKMLLVYGEFII
jgi:hypothetical protein